MCCSKHGSLTDFLCPMWHQLLLRTFFQSLQEVRSRQASAKGGSNTLQLACTYLWTLVFLCFGVLVYSMYSIYSIYSNLFDLRSIRCSVHTGNIPPLNELIRQRKQKGGGGGSLKIKVLVANTIIELSFYWKLIFSLGLCGHFALSTLLEA